MNVGLLALITAGCASQVLVMERGSSGAVERDSDFRPLVGNDHHYISLPAYPLVNCTDPLVYDHLVDLVTALLGTEPLPESLPRQPPKNDRAADVIATYDYLRDARLRFQHSHSPLEITGAVDHFLYSAKTGRFAKSDIEEVFPGPPAKLVDDLLELQDDASSFGPSPCSSSMRYGKYVGYTKATAREVSWLRADDQHDALTELARSVGVAAPKADARTDVSFLHFSDVQIREPGAKLGGSALSHQLRSLVSSFEQEYVQELYAKFVYDAIVKTVNAEIDLVAGDNGERISDDERRARPKPSFMIHTGDSADTGMQSEFDTFLAETNQLRVPWYQVIGNHDVLAFGNLRLMSGLRKGVDRDARCQNWGAIRCSCTDVSTLVRAQEIRTPDNRGSNDDTLPAPAFAIAPVLLQRICLLHAVASDWFVMDPDRSPKEAGLNNAVDSFILSHCEGWHPSPAVKDRAALAAATAALERCKEEDPSKHDYAHRPTGTDECATRDGTSVRSTMHGFDARNGFDFTHKVANNKPEDNLGGYYCFEMPTEHKEPDAPKAWGIVLNTNTELGSYGVISDAQLAWLRKLLLDGDCDHKQIRCNDYVMVFSHHPIYSLYEQKQRIELTKIVTASPNVIAYIAGHTHNAGLRTIRPINGQPGHAKWEIVAPSVVDFPQAARQILIKSADELGYLEVLTFTPHGSGEAARKIGDATRGSVRDRCRDRTKCDDTGNAILPPREATFPRAFFRTPASTRQHDRDHPR